MTKDDIIKLAREAGLNVEQGFLLRVTGIDEDLERFAELVIKPWADQLEVERKRFQELNDVVATGMQHARAAEREACAKVCEDYTDKSDADHESHGYSCAAAIRARGNT